MTVVATGSAPAKMPQAQGVALEEVADSGQPLPCSATPPSPRGDRVYFHQKTRDDKEPAPEASSDYDSLGNTALWEKFTQLESARFRARRLAVELARDRKDSDADVLAQKVRLKSNRFLQETARVESGRGLFEDESGSFRGSIQRMKVENRELTFYVVPTGSKDIKRMASGLFEPDAPVVSQAKSASPRGGTSRLVPQPTRCADDPGMEMLRNYESLILPTRLYLEHRLAQAQRTSGREGRRAVAAVQTELDLLRCEHGCVETGTGWFQVDGRWVAAKVTSVEYAISDTSERAVLVLRTADGREQRWPGGRCQQYPPSHCCAVL